MAGSDGHVSPPSPTARASDWVGLSLSPEGGFLPWVMAGVIHMGRALNWWAGCKFLGSLARGRVLWSRMQIPRACSGCICD